MTQLKQAPIIRLFDLEVKPDYLADFGAVGQENLTQSIKTEPGTLAMYATHYPERPEQVIVVEVYQDNQAYETHIASTQFAGFLQVAQEGLAARHMEELEAQLLLEKDQALYEPFASPQLVRLAKIELRPECVADFSAIVRSEMKASMEKEAGVLVMYATSLKDRPNIWWFFEVYASQEAYDSHRETPHFKEYIDGTSAMLLDKELISLVGDTLVNQGGLVYEAKESC